MNVYMAPFIFPMCTVKWRAMQMNLTHFQSLTHTHHSTHLTRPSLLNPSSFTIETCSETDTALMTVDTWRLGRAREEHVSMPLANYRLDSKWQWLVVQSGCMSVCLLSRLGPRHVLSFTLDFDPQSLTLQMPHKFPIYSMSLTKTKSQLRFWECFQFSRDSRWISSWSHSFIWLLLNIERFILSHVKV